jgi:uncharacterized protein (DUF2147 family)
MPPPMLVNNCHVANMKLSSELTKNIYAIQSQNGIFIQQTTNYIMKILYTLLFTTCSFLFAVASSISMDNPDAIVGNWKTGEGTAVVQIYKQGNNYFGKIVWLKEPNNPTTGKPRVDAKNSDPAKRNSPLLGLINLRNFSFHKNNLWKDGKIYDPKSGDDYSCKITMKDPNTIEVRGYIGISLLGRTDVWKRQNNL